MTIYNLRLSLFLIAFAIIHQSTAFANDIDWNRAKALFQKKKSGQVLSEAESAYLEKAMQARSKSRDEVTRGDGSAEKATVAPIEISEAESPLKMLPVTAADGNRLEVVYRAPKADRPLPAIVFIHGSLGQRKKRELMENARSGPTQTRFLAAGYVAVCATFRTYVDDPQSEGPILDTVAIVQAVKNLPEVDPESVIIFGTSGGGSIALDVAGRKAASPRAIVVGEPATVLYTGLMTGIENRDASMKDFATLYTEKHRQATEKKIAAISCPILIHHGDIHPLKKINFELVFPTIEKAGKTMVIKRYPKENHGFYWGNRTTEETVNQVVASTIEFIEPWLKSQPARK